MARRPRKTSEAALRRRVEHRARQRCEYCRAPQAISGYRFHLEHIVPAAKGGSDAFANRALACATCNLAKGDRQTALDPDTGVEVPLFHPRKQAWQEHFRWAEDRETLVGRTPTGRATIIALSLNSELRKQARRHWFATGWLP